MNVDTPQNSGQPATIARRHASSMRARLPGRFSILLATMLLLFVVQPFFEGHWLALILLNIFVSGVLLSGIYAVSQKKRDLFVACFLALPALVGRWLLLFTTHQVIFFVSTVFALSFFVFTAAIILRHVVRARQVTADTISAALCSYLLIGMVWAQPACRERQGAAVDKSSLALLQAQAKRSGKSKLSSREIEAEIAAVRKEKAKRSA